MKKHSILFLAILAMAACSKENTQDIVPDFNQNATSNLEVRGSFDEESTRITTEDGLGFALEANKEQIGVYIRTGAYEYPNIKYTAGAADENGWITFTTESAVEVFANSQIFAYAPYSATNISVNGSTEGGATEQAITNGKWDGKRTINLPDTQTQVAENDFAHLTNYYTVVATPAMPAAREALDSFSVDLQFSGVFALVRFVLENSQDSDVTVSKLVLSADAALTGHFNVDLTHENPKIANSEYALEAVDGKTFGKVEVSLASPVVLAAGKQTELFAVVNAATVKTPKIEVYGSLDGKDVVFEKVFASDKTFARNKRVALGVKLENPTYITTEPAYDEETKTYTITNASELAWIAQTVNNGDNLSQKNVVLANDIDLNNIEWTPIGTKDASFAGAFDGNGKTISNLTVNRPDDAFNGLFGRMITPGTIANVNILNANVIGYDEVAAVVGSAYQGKVSGCNVSGNIVIEGHYHVGGIAGYGYATITNCNVNGNAGSYVKGTYLKADFEGDAVGGIIGYAAEKNNSENKIISECSVTIDVIGTRKVGGIVGQCGKDANVYGCTFKGNVSIDAPDTYIAGNTGKIMIGGIVGELTGTSLFIKNSTVAEGSTVTGVDAKTTGATLGGSRTAGYVLTEENNTTTGVIVTPSEDLGYKEVDGGYEVYSVKGMQWLAEQVNGGNNFSGKTVTLTADIDLDGIEWTPIGTNPDSTTLRFDGIFDGNNKTISNLNVNTTVNGVPSGLFGAVSGTVKNFTIEHATINSVNVQTNRSTGVAVGIGYPSAKIQNVTVKDATINAFRQVGGIVGYLYGTVSGCTVDGLTIDAPLDSANDNGDKVGGIAGFMGGDSGICFGNKVANANIKAYRDVGGILGIIYKGSIDTFKDNTITDSTIEGTKDKNANAGAIVGRYEGTSAAEIDSSNTATDVTVIPGGGNEVVAEGIELTSDGTYNIVSAAGVKSLAALVNAGDDFAGKTITLVADADLGEEEWTPIGNGSRSGSTYTGNAFKGTFDGNGKTISGLKISSLAGKAATGLFGVLDGGTVKNVTLEVNIDVASNSNELAAGCVGLLTNNGLVENVTVSGSVSGSEAAAGVVSRVIKSGTVRNCHNHATINGTSYNIGGIVGAAYYNNEGMAIEGCTNDGAVNGTYAVGGIVGLSAAEVKNCSNSATVTGNGSSIGGVVGEQQNAGNVTGCTNTGDVKNNTTAYGNGGIIGWIRYSGGSANYPNMNIITVSGCENRGSVTGGNDAGGIVGTVYNYGVIDSNKNYAPILSAKSFVAGVVGNVQFDGNHAGITDEEHVYVTNNYSETTLDNMIGGLKAKFVYINNSDKTTDSGNTPDDGVQVSTAEEAIAAIQGGGKVTVAGAIDKIDFTTLNPTAPVELVLNAKVGEIVLGSSASNPAQTTITVAKDVDYPAFSVVKGKDIQNLTIIGDPTSSKACTSGINALNQGITTVKNVTIQGVRFQGKGVHFGFTHNPQTTQNIVIEDCEGIDMVEPLFYTSNNKYANTVVGDITIRNNKATFSASAATNVNALYICVTTTGTVLIENNTFINPPKHGIMADSNACDEFIVRGNTFTNPVEDGVKIDYPINNVVIENNTITPSEYGIRVARFNSNYNPTVTITGNSIDMSQATATTFNGISIAGNVADGQAKLIVKNNIKAGGDVAEWFGINSELALNDGSDIATPFNN